MLRFLLKRSHVILVTALSVTLPACALLSPEPIEVRPAPSGLGLIYPVGSITTAQRADEALRDASASRLAIEQQYRAEQLACSKKFFVSDCTDAAKERHRIARAETRAVEVEADFVKRRDRAEQRDASIAQRAVQDAARAPQQLKETEAREKTAAEKLAQQKQGELKTIEAQQKTVGLDPQARQRAYDGKIAQQNKKQASQQAGRNANVVAFEKKKAAALARQKQIAENKAKKAAEQTEKDANPKNSAGDNVPTVPAASTAPGK